jgi:tetratricopeptide (TPR) repeat protein
MTAWGSLGDQLPPVFRDRDELASSADLAAAVREGLEQSATLIVVCSPRSAQSRWVNEEIRSFVELGRRDRIRLLIVDGEPGSTDPTLDPIPPAILADGAAEPLAADARKSQDGKTGAFLKVLAGLLDVPYDELRQREAQRRQRRLAIVATASTVGLIATTGLAVIAWLARNEAVRQREVAMERTMTAERTLDFVKSMFRVADPSEARGANIAAREVVDRGARMLDEGLEQEPAVKADLGVTLAEVYGALGLYQRSDALVRRSFAVRHDQPPVLARQYAALGESQSRLGDYEAAQASFRNAARLLEGQGATEALRSRVLAGLGQAQSARDEFDVANATLRRALAIDRARGAEGRADVARDLEALGLNAFYSGDIGAARPLITQALALRRETGGEASPSVADNLNTLASIAYLEGDLAEAESLYRRNLAVDERVLGPEHPDLAITLNNLARMQIEQRKFATAVPLLERAEVIAEAERGELHDDMVFVYANLAIALRHTGQPRRAEQLLGQALAAARQHGHRALGPILAEIADLRCQSGRAAEGAPLLEEAARVTAADYPDDPWRTAWVETVRASCLERAGRAEEGRALLRRSAPVLAARWPATTLFGAEARRRAAAAGLRIAR